MLDGILDQFKHFLYQSIFVAQVQKYVSWEYNNISFSKKKKKKTAPWRKLVGDSQILNKSNPNPETITFQRL
jgi:hypothetical protein